MNSCPKKVFNSSRGSLRLGILQGPKELRMSLHGRWRQVDYSFKPTYSTKKAYKLHLRSSAFTHWHKVKLEAVPTFISVLGLFDVEYRRHSEGGWRSDEGGWKVHHWTMAARITVACRDGNIYTVKNGQARTPWWLESDLNRCEEDSLEDHCDYFRGLLWVESNADDSRLGTILPSFWGRKGPP